MKTRISFLLTLALFAGTVRLQAQGTGFTYQGRLNTGTNPATGTFDLTFSLYGVSSGGSPLAGPVNTTGVGVANGLFTVLVDFGAGVFTGGSNWLSIGVRTNGGGAFTPLTPREQVTPAPYAIFAESASAAGLSGTIPAADLSGVNGSGLTGVNAATLSGLSASSFWQLTGNTLGAGQFLGSLNSQPLFIQASGGVGIGTPSPQQGLSVKTGMNLDQANLNTGVLNNGNTNGTGLTFGLSSGEGIASQRQVGAGNRYGLDFYTDFARRMSISQGGLVGIGVGTNAPDAALEVANGDVRIDGNRLLLSAATTGSFANDGLYYDMAGLPGINDDTGPFLGGYLGGALGGLGPTVACLSWDPSGNVWVNDNLSAGSLTVRGDYLVVNGGTPVYAYLGDDGSGNDVQIGSQKSGVTAVSCYNTADSAYMHLYVSSITIKGGSDLAEPFEISAADQKVSEGAVVVIDQANPGHLKLSSEPYDTRVAGVVSGANGVNPGIQMQQQGLLEGGKNVALTGRVYVQADTSNGAIKPGDLLTTSSTPGHAMKLSDHARAAGAILGKAMTGLSEGKGMVLVLATLQ